MNLNPLAANMTELVFEGMTVLFSYRTPVAVLMLEKTAEGASWHQYRTEKRWSNTTTRHINKWNPMGGAFGMRPQEFFDNLVAMVKS